LFENGAFLPKNSSPSEELRCKFSDFLITVLREQVDHVVTGAQFESVEKWELPFVIAVFVGLLVSPIKSHALWFVSSFARLGSSSP